MLKLYRGKKMTKKLYRNKKNKAKYKFNQQLNNHQIIKNRKKKKMMKHWK